MTDMPPRIPVGITLDLHYGDTADDILFSAEWLQAQGVPATFFIHSSLFAEQRYAGVLRDLPRFGHEVASHTHQHDDEEGTALRTGTRSRLGFLRESCERHAEFYGVAPRSFRSPGWCKPGPAALDMLEELGYVTDSSATPQRLSFLSSRPFDDAWTFSRRRPYLLRPNLLEVPTSTCFVPAGSPTFLIFRRALSLAFVQALSLEATLRGPQPLVLQFHPSDFNPRSALGGCCGPLRWRDFLLRRQGGFGFKHQLKDTDRARIAGTTQAIIGALAHGRFETLAGIAQEFRRCHARVVERVPAVAASRAS